VPQVFDRDDLRPLSTPVRARSGHGFLLREYLLYNWLLPLARGGRDAGLLLEGAGRIIGKIELPKGG